MTEKIADAHMEFASNYGSITMALLLFVQAVINVGKSLEQSRVEQSRGTKRY